MAQPALIDGNTVAAEVVTEVRRKEALLKTGALQNAIFNSANFSSIATDEKGVIQLFNVGAERMLGYAAAEVLNKITPADISDPQEVIARAEALERRARDDDHAGLRGAGLQGLARDRGHLRADLHPQGRQPLSGGRVGHGAARRSQGAIIGYLLIGTDNTARKQVEAEQKKLDQRLRDQQFYTRSLIESNIDALMTTDPRGIITDVNKQMEALTGCTRDELIGAPFKNYFTDPERAEAAHQAGAERKEGHRLRADRAAPGTARRRWCPTTPPPSTTGTGSCRACSPPRATSPSASASSRRSRKPTSSWRAPSPRRRKPTSRNPISCPA